MIDVKSCFLSDLRKLTVLTAISSSLCNEAAQPCGYGHIESVSFLLGRSFRSQSEQREHFCEIDETFRLLAFGTR